MVMLIGSFLISPDLDWIMWEPMYLLEGLKDGTILMVYHQDTDTTRLGLYRDRAPLQAGAGSLRNRREELENY